MAPSRLTPPPTNSSLEGIEGLTPDQLSFFHTNGYLLVPDYLSQQDCATLLSKTRSMLTNLDLSNHPMTKFSTGETEAHVGDTYFLESGDKVRFFFEEDAFDRSTGELTKPKERAINKIGHNLHGLVPEFGNVSHAGKIGQRNAAIARDLGYSDPRLLQSMVICKQPEIGGAVPPHQDNTFLFTDRPSAVGFWIALEDATVENGCLSFDPGSHKRAPVRERFVRKPDNSGTTFEKVHGELRWPRNFEHKDEDDWDEEEYVLGEVKAGTLVLIHGNVLHKSEKNLSQKGRTIYTFHCIEGSENYDEKNWLQIPGGPGQFTKLNGTVAQESHILELNR